MRDFEGEGDLGGANDVEGVDGFDVIDGFNVIDLHKNVLAQLPESLLHSGACSIKLFTSVIYALAE